ncbi:MAG: type II/IV secretion system ATPase subunit [Thermoplasmata archaeon]
MALFIGKRKGRTGVTSIVPKDLLIMPHVPTGYVELEFYNVEPGYSAVKIFKDEGGFGDVIYWVIEPILTLKEQKELERYIKILMTRLPEKITFQEDVNIELKKKRLREYILEDMMSRGFSKRSGEKIYYELYKKYLAYGPLTVPIKDKNNIEDITVTRNKVYIYHKKYGSIKTNIVFQSDEDSEKLIRKITEMSGKHISYVEPIVDSSLPDGSRIQATISNDVVITGPALSVRKFTEKPFTPIDLIRSNTASSEIYAYLWLAVQYFANIMIIGGTATGKTTMLNSILMFAKPFAKIVSIEDTRELNLYHENWVPAVTRGAVGVINPYGIYEKVGEITMMDLVKNVLRQRPEYLVVGEVRGQEAAYMFQALATGKTGYTTFHAEDVESAVKRLTEPPLNIPKNQIANIDIFIVLKHAIRNNIPVRRIFEVDEYYFDKNYERMNLNPYFQWDSLTDTFKVGIESYILRKISEVHGIDIDYLKFEYKKRVEFLDNMVKSNQIYDVVSFTTKIFKYYASESERQKEYEEVGRL